MTNRTTMTAALAGAGAGALMLLAAPAEARPIYIKIDDIKGEATDAAVSSDHDRWIELQSLKIAGGASVPPPGAIVAGRGAGPRARGGVSVAAGDVDGDGRAERRPGGPRGLAAPGPDPVPAGLLLPAVQKVREAAAAMPAGEACRLGPVRGAVAVHETESGATGRILDATVTKCSAEQISLNFTKIEWD